MDKVKEEKQVNTTPAEESGKFKGKRKFGGRRPQGGRNDVPDEFQQRLVDLARVTRVMAGGKRMKFRACIVIGDGKGRVGSAVAKGSDVSDSISKAVSKAKKQLIKVPIIDGTIPHDITIKFKAARLLIKPARKGSGIKAGGVVRTVLELAGVSDAVGKILGSNNKLNNVEATIQALSSFKGSSFKHHKKVEAKEDRKSEYIAK